jgi:parallel beta-helix repeat protein
MPFSAGLRTASSRRRRPHAPPATPPATTTASTSENRVNGIVLFGGNTGNVIDGNHADNNGVNGIFAMLGATGNRFDQNSMHGNGSVDARDANPLLSGALQNDWTGNDCDTDFPAGLICGVG